MTTAAWKTRPIGAPAAHYLHPTHQDEVTANHGVLRHGVWVVLDDTEPDLEYAASCAVCEGMGTTPCTTCGGEGMAQVCGLPDCTGTYGCPDCVRCPGCLRTRPGYQSCPQRGERWCHHG